MPGKRSVGIIKSVQNYGFILIPHPTYCETIHAALNDTVTRGGLKLYGKAEVRQR
ncbi:MAG: hypothetical protein LBK66_04160 [Spirochaetaceae bacterium]|nr:hypothetical protein [Spirochaetaceae bacterium]